MPFERLNFTCSWEDPADFPAYEPNEGKVRADLQKLHDECRDGLNRLVDDLNGPDAAAKLRFHSDDLRAENVRDAIRETYGAIRDASTGLIVDGSVTKAKLDPELLERSFGGRTWVSMDEPGESDTPERGFPVGQIWLRPAYTVENRLGTAWDTEGCAAEASDQGLRLIGDGSLAETEAVQTLSGLGLPGEACWVAVKVQSLDAQLTGLSLELNGAVHDLLAGGVFETALDRDGGLTMTIRAVWPAAALATGTVALRDLAVINGEAVETGLEGCLPLTDWPGLLSSLGAFSSVRLPRRRWTQERPGLWAETDFEILPVSRGGTGLDALLPGQLLYAGSDGRLHTLDAPAATGSLLAFDQGAPHWTTRDQLVADTGTLRWKEGTYTGSEKTRTVPLLQAVKQVTIFGSDLKAPVVLIPGSTNKATIPAGGPTGVYYTTGVDLSADGRTLSMWMQASSGAMEDGATPLTCNKAGVQYKWSAVV